MPPRVFSAATGAVLVMLMLGGSSSAAGLGMVAYGTFGAVSWKLSATDTADGHFCLTMALPERGGGRSSACGSIFGLAAGRAHGITFLAHTGRPAPDYIVGPVVATAKTVVIALSSGKTIKTRTIAPPTGLTGKISFYVAELPCPAEATSVRGIDAGGHDVAHLAIRPLQAPGTTTC